MKIKRYQIPREKIPFKVDLPSDGWIVDFSFIDNVVYAEIVVKDDEPELVTKELFVANAVQFKSETKEYDVNIDDLMLLGTCGDSTVKFFIFEVAPKYMIEGELLYNESMEEWTTDNGTLQAWVKGFIAKNDEN